MIGHDIRELLERHTFFAGLDEQTLAFIAGCGSNVVFRAGERIFAEGHPADELYIIRVGHVALEVVAPGRGPMMVDTLGSGEILGTSWLVPPYRWSLDARAVQTTRAVRLDATCLRAKCNDEPRLGYELMQRLAVVMQQRMMSARMRLVDLYGTTAVG